jgi:NADPH:quinone reductase-like Zn-dependent oxidoreductase
MKQFQIQTGSPLNLSLQEAAAPTPFPNQALIQVHATSLNRGEVRMSAGGRFAEGYVPGWDLAGVVTQAAADGSGPKVGTRVVAIARAGAWAEYAAIGTEYIAPIPDNVTFAQAATLPVAGLTALHALKKRGLLLGKSVLVTGATGGVGDFALQLARLSGAHTVAHLRKDQEINADEKVVGSLKGTGPYDLIVEGVGGPLLGEALAELGVDGVAVNYANSTGELSSFDASDFYWVGRTRLEGIVLFFELQRTEGGDVGLKTLADLVGAGKLDPHISVTAPFEKLPEIAQDLLDRKYPGKAVLTVAH